MNTPKHERLQDYIWKLMGYGNGVVIPYPLIDAFEEYYVKVAHFEIIFYILLRNK